MNSVDFAKLASTYLKLPSQVAATAAEELYAKGIVSYPRTETQVFDESIDLPALVAAHAGHSVWGGIARDMVCPGGKFEKPRAGEKHDGAHPPSAWSVECGLPPVSAVSALPRSASRAAVHPLRSIERRDVSDVQWRVYELITRHFLACCHRDARGSTTTLTVAMAGETFTASGTVVHELNFMEVYTYQVRRRWACGSAEGIS